MKKLQLIITASLLLSCSTTPTGRSQLKLMPEGQMTKMGNTSFNDLKKKRKTSDNKKQNEAVKCITNRLLLAMGEKPKEWQIEVFIDESPNAFALPGKNMGVHTGMIKLVKNNDQLAAVIGHEIGHVLADHGNERVSQNMLTQGVVAAGAVALGNNPKRDLILVGAMGLAQYGVLMPFSRSHESEADALGVKYMAKAGFDPKEAAELWKLMSKDGGKTPPEFLSTHPSPKSRIEALTKLAPKYEEDFKSSPNKNSCPKV